MFHIVCIVLAALVMGCTNPEGSFDPTSGYTSPVTCPAGGTACFNEGSVCGSGEAAVTCHCGTMLAAGNPAATQACQVQSVCLAGTACATEGLACGSTLECICGRWQSVSQHDGPCQTTLSCANVTCPAGHVCAPQGGKFACIPTSGPSNDPSPATCANVMCPAGFACELMNGNPSCAVATSTPGTLAVTILSGGSEHIWCEGGTVMAADAAKDDTAATWLRGWASWGCDSYDGHYTCSYSYNAAAERPRFQCYLKSNGVPAGQAPDGVRYTCAKPSMLAAGESFSPSQNYLLVRNQDPTSGYNCSIQ